MNQVVRQTNLSRIDLNLLVVFDAIAETRSVTLAANRLSLSQPAVSHSLKRLRQLLDDELFVRGRDQFSLTRRAASLYEPIREMLSSVREALDSPTFDPAITTKSFRIAASEYALMTVVPTLANQLHIRAPHAEVSVQALNDSTLPRLEAGELDIAFWGTAPPKLFMSAELFLESHVGVIDAQHPLAFKAAANAVTLDDYLAYPHVGVSLGLTLQNPVDVALSKLGRERQIAVRTPSFLGNIGLLAGTPLIASLPSRLLDVRLGHELVTFKLPIDEPKYPYSLIWHRRTANDPHCVWLRELVLSGLLDRPPVSRYQPTEYWDLF